MKKVCCLFRVEYLCNSALFYIEGTVMLRVEGVVHCEIVCGFMIIYSFVYLLCRL